MTKDAERSDEVTRSEQFRKLLADMDIHETQGVELLRTVHMVGNAYDAIMAERMRDEQFSAPRWRLLLRLWIEERHGRMSVNPTQLSKTQSVSKNTISAHLRSLEEHGLIQRELDPDDLRQFRIRLSEAGRHFVRTHTPGYMALLNELVSELSSDEADELLALLHKLHLSLCLHGKLEAVCAAWARAEYTGDTEAA